MREATKKTWRCQTCRVGRSRNGSVDKLQRDATESSHTEQLAGANININHVLIDIQLKLDTLRSLQRTVNNIEQAVLFVSEKYNNMLADTARNEKVSRDIKSRFQVLAPIEIKSMKDQLNDLEWRNHKLNLKFHGVEQREGEDFVVKINDVAKMLKVFAFLKDDVVAAYRLRMAKA